MPRQRIARFAGAQPIVSYDPDHGFSVTRQDAEGNQETTQLSTLLMEPGEPFILPACNHILSGRTSEERLRACPVCFYPRNNLYNIESTISFLDQENGELSYPQSNWWGRLPERIEGESSIAMQPYTRDTVEALALERCWPAVEGCHGTLMQRDDALRATEGGAP